MSKKVIFIGALLLSGTSFGLGFWSGWTNAFDRAKQILESNELLDLSESVSKNILLLTIIRQGKTNELVPIVEGSVNSCVSELLSSDRSKMDSWEQKQIDLSIDRVKKYNHEFSSDLKTTTKSSSK